MSKLIVLTGFMGSGKSYAAKRFDDRAYCIDGDHLFSTSHRTLRPEIPRDSPERNNWDGWPHHKRDVVTVCHIFSTSIAQAHPELGGHRGHVIADGAIFVYDWFREPLIEALTAVQPFEAVHLLYLNLPDEQLHQNIHSRGKPRQMAQYPTVESVKRGNDGFKAKFGPSRSRWEEFSRYEAFEERMREILAGIRPTPSP